MKNPLFLFIFIFSFFIGEKNAFSISCWNQKTDFGGEARHRGVAFSIGSRGYMGLGHVNSVVDILYDDIWEYDPGTNSWMQKANFGGGLRYHSVAFTIGNKGYVGTGRMPGGTYNNDLWEYNPVTNIWTVRAPMPAVARRGAVAFVANGEGYVGTGQTTSGYAVDFMKYNPVTNSWAAVAPLIGFARTSAVAFAINDKGYVGTGGANDFYMYDPLTNSWSIKAVVGPTSRMEATGFSVGGKGYIGTGDNFSSGDNYGDFWEYEPTTNTWVQIEDFGGIARRYLVSFVIGNKAYCGTGTGGTNYKDFWEFDPALIGIGVDEINSSSLNINVYPNPVSDILNIELASSNDKLNSSQIKIVNLEGQFVHTQNIDDNLININCATFEKGNYLVLVYDESNNITASKKIVIH